jgi:hypothetical protein
MPTGSSMVNSGEKCGWCSSAAPLGTCNDAQPHIQPQHRPSGHLSPQAVDDVWLNLEAWSLICPVLYPILPDCPCSFPSAILFSTTQYFPPLVFASTVD